MIEVGSHAAIWDDVEHGSYRADLDLWAELSRGRDPILDLGCGAGRVALHLARAGHQVYAFDREPELIRALHEHAEAEGLTVASALADVRGFGVGDMRFGVVLAAMQLVHLVDEEGRATMLDSVRRHLKPDGLFAAALLEAPTDRPVTWDETEEVPLPDVRERGGWVFSSLPLSVSADASGFTVERLRQTVSPSGELTDEQHVVHLEALEPERFESEARAAGLVPVQRRPIPQTEEHVGSTVVVLRRLGADAGRPR